MYFNNLGKKSLELQLQFLLLLLILKIICYFFDFHCIIKSWSLFGPTTIKVNYFCTIKLMGKNPSFNASSLKDSLGQTNEFLIQNVCNPW